MVESNLQIPLEEWLMRNLLDEDKGIDFGLICWHLWKQRNEEVLDGKSYSEQGILCKIGAWFNIIRNAHSFWESIANEPRRVLQTKEIAWKPPHHEWIQIQSDGSVHHDSGKAAAGGLFRDHLGRCHRAFVCNLGSCSITHAELKGAMEGLKIAWEEGYRKIELNLDSETAISIINNHSEDDHRHGQTAAMFRNLLDRDWEIKISHVYRESNCAADYLANVGHDSPFGTHSFDVCDPGLRYWLQYDVMGIAQERSINTMH
ncbi:unnamed protein product [Linum trigynum]|uniref:RNase H type-1 domain-containing protein n=1 Tax=Linum trigynum TaxID=586398 RepID=A0AAV2FP96_9ROSI